MTHSNVSVLETYSRNANSLWYTWIHKTKNRQPENTHKIRREKRKNKKANWKWRAREEDSKGKRDRKRASYKITHNRPKSDFKQWMKMKLVGKREQRKAQTHRKSAEKKVFSLSFYLVFSKVLLFDSKRQFIMLKIKWFSCKFVI